MKRIMALLLCIVLAAGYALAEDAEPEWLTQGMNALAAGNYEEAFEYFLAGANQGDAQGQYVLGAMYAEGAGVEQSDEKAAEYWLLAADQGHKDAQFYLGVMYETGSGLEQSDEKALEYYLMAADQGQADAQNKVGTLYAQGIGGVELSYEKAAYYYQLAADQGQADGQYNMAYMYEEGLGVEQSYEKALELYQLAMEQGHSLAGQDYERLKETLEKRAGDAIRLLDCLLCSKGPRILSTTYSHSKLQGEYPDYIGSILVWEQAGSIQLIQIIAQNMELLIYPRGTDAQRRAWVGYLIEETSLIGIKEPRVFVGEMTGSFSEDVKEMELEDFSFYLVLALTDDSKMVLSINDLRPATQEETDAWQYAFFEPAGERITRSYGNLKMNHNEDGNEYQNLINLILATASAMEIMEEYSIYDMESSTMRPGIYVDVQNSSVHAFTGKEMLTIRMAGDAESVKEKLSQAAAWFLLNLFSMDVSIDSTIYEIAEDEEYYIVYPDGADGEWLSLENTVYPFLGTEYDYFSQ